MSEQVKGKRSLNEGYQPSKTPTGPNAPPTSPSNTHRGYQGGYQAPSTGGNKIPPTGGSGVVAPKKK